MREGDGLQRLKSFVQNLSPITEEEWEKVLPLLAPRELEKNELFVRVGEKNYVVGFVTSGIIRKFYLDKDGHEYTNGFAAENQLAAPYEALLSNSPAEVNLQALEKTKMITFDYGDYQALSKNVPAWREVGLRVAEHMLLLREKRQAQMLMKSAGDRYEDFLRDYPNLKNRVPGYQIASFIGITPEALSRLRGKRK